MGRLLSSIGKIAIGASLGATFGKNAETMKRVADTEMKLSDKIALMSTMAVSTSLGGAMAGAMRDSSRGDTSNAPTERDIGAAGALTADTPTSGMPLQRPVTPPGGWKSGNVDDSQFRYSVLNSMNTMVLRLDTIVSTLDHIRTAFNESIAEGSFGGSSGRSGPTFGGLDSESGGSGGSGHGGLGWIADALEGGLLAGSLGKGGRAGGIAGEAAEAGTKSRYGKLFGTAGKDVAQAEERAVAKRLGGKIPIIGGLIAGGLEYADSGSVGRAGAAGGGTAIGTWAGGALGSLLDPILGPFGTLGGAAIGGMIGEHFGVKGYDRFTDKDKDQSASTKDEADITAKTIVLKADQIRFEGSFYGLPGAEQPAPQQTTAPVAQPTPARTPAEVPEEVPPAAAPKSPKTTRRANPPEVDSTPAASGDSPQPSVAESHHFSLSGVLGDIFHHGKKGGEGSKPTLADIEAMPDGSFKQRRDKAMKFFISQGFTVAQASGIVGNLIAESHLDPGIHNIGNHSSAFGIGQWVYGKNGKEDPDSRRGNLERMFGSTPSFTDQLKFIMWEVQNVKYERDMVWDRIHQANTVEDATKAWLYYERPGTGPMGTGRFDPSSPESSHNFSKRLKNAEGLDDSYEGKGDLPDPEEPVFSPRPKATPVARPATAMQPKTKPKPQPSVVVQQSGAPQIHVAPPAQAQRKPPATNTMGWARGMWAKGLVGIFMFDQSRWQ